MKLASAGKNPTMSTPNDPHATHPDGGQVTFFRHMAEVAGINRKEFVFDCRVSGTLVDGWFSGEKNDPFTQARRALSLYARVDRRWLIPGILAWIAGGDSFDGRIIAPAVKESLPAGGK